MFLEGCGGSVVVFVVFLVLFGILMAGSVFLLI